MLLMMAVETCLLICVVALCRANVGRSPTGDGGRLGRFQLEFARSRSLLPVAAGGRGEGRLRSLVSLHCTSAMEGNRSQATCCLNLVEQTDGNKRLYVCTGIVCLHIQSAIYFCFRDIF